MINYILAENMKHKNSFLKKLIYILPAIPVFLSYIMMPFYFTANAYNWWYIILLPMTFALIPSLMNRKEERKLKYKTIFSLNINLKKAWISKIITASIYIFISEIIHLILVFVLQKFVSNQFYEAYEFKTLFMASIILIISNIWQIPFCFFLAKKFGFITSIFINTILASILGVLFSSSPLWIYCPYSWGIRLMVSVLKILPNGTIANLSNPMILNTSLIIPCILSLVIFIFITIISSNWFSNLEAK